MEPIRWETGRKVESDEERKMKFRVVKKLAGGLVRAAYSLNSGRIEDFRLTGDFFFYPEEKLALLEREVEGRTPAELQRIIMDFYERHGIESPGISPEGLAKAIIDVKGSENGGEEKDGAEKH